MIPTETCKENTPVANIKHSTDVNDTIHDNNTHIEMNPIGSSDEQFHMEFVITSDNEEAGGIKEKSDNQENNRGIKRKTNITKETGVSLLRKVVTPELRTDGKKLKKMHQQIPHEISERDREMKEELHQIRMQILKKELEIKENHFLAELEINSERLKTAFESETNALQKQIKKVELDRLLLELD